MLEKLHPDSPTIHQTPFSKMPATPVIVQLDDVKLKLTCTETLLQKTLADAVIQPFLGAFNKKRSANISVGQLSAVLVDGHEIADTSASAADVFGDAAAPTVELRCAAVPPTPPPPPLSGVAAECEDAIAQLLELPADAAVEVWQPPLHVLRTHSRDSAEAPGVAERLLAPKVVLLAARRACVVADELPAAAAAAALEAATLLNNMMRIDRDKAGRALAAAGSSAVPDLIALLAAAPTVALLRLRYIGQISFQLSLLPAVSSGSHAAAFAAAVRSALAWVSATLRFPPAEQAEEEVGHAGGLAADLCKATFNMLRARPNDGATDAKKVELESLLASMLDLLGAPSANEDVVEAKLACLQMAVTMPKELAYPRLSAAWKPLVALLPALLEVNNGADEGNAPILPLLTLQCIAEADADAAAAMRAHLFPPEFLTAEVDPADPYRPAALAPGWDPNNELPKDAPVHMRLLQKLTCTNYNLKRVAGDFLFALGAGDDAAKASEFVRLVGLGSAAGLLQERDMLSAFQQLAQAGRVQHGAE